MNATGASTRRPTPLCGRLISGKSAVGLSPARKNPLVPMMDPPSPKAKAKPTAQKQIAAIEKLTRQKLVVESDHPVYPTANEAVARAIADKMVARHPHIFGDETGAMDDIRWESLKAAEREAIGIRVQAEAEREAATNRADAIRLIHFPDTKDEVIQARRRIVFDGPPAALPAVWHDPSHAH